MALRRAAHQLVDRPLVFDDPLALRILGLSDPKAQAQSDLRAPVRPSSKSLRAFLVARSRFAEDTLLAAVQDSGLRQYVLLGAGLDTFAYRNTDAGLHVFEVDHPDTQSWKLDLLAAHGIAVPKSMVHVAVDFHVDALAEKLLLAGFDGARPAVFAWLGVVPYLTEAAFLGTLQYLSTCAKGSYLLMDYGLPRAALPFLEQLAFDSLAARVAAAGEPFRLFFRPEDLHRQLAEVGWQVREDLDRQAINSRYFSDRADGLRCLGSGAHLLAAVLVTPQHTKLIEP